MAEAILVIRDLHAYYGKSHVLHGVDLDVNKSEIVSLLGRKPYEIAHLGLGYVPESRDIFPTYLPARLRDGPRPHRVRRHAGRTARQRFGPQGVARSLKTPKAGCRGCAT